MAPTPSSPWFVLHLSTTSKGGSIVESQRHLLGCQTHLKRVRGTYLEGQRHPLDLRVPRAAGPHYRSRTLDPPHHHPSIARLLDRDPIILG